ncbi:FMN-dependent NADH-azoreductase [Alloalcanivorax xenomutans]|uniref:FMN-dependent NADH-azoreductase n=1 Tax=Alloalcanivorax xenomutans TaxID=1094342 RepID=UPI003BACA783
MTTLLHLDASPRPGRSGTDEHGSHTRRLTDHFVTQWRRLRPGDAVMRRDIGSRPPALTTVEWIQAAFTAPDRHQPWMKEVLAESDALVQEVLDADILVLGVPMYNFSYPAAFKAWIDNIVRAGRTVDFDPSNPEDPFTPLLADRPRHAVILSSRGGFGMNPGGPLAHVNHLEASIRTALEFIGIERFHEIAIEHQEEGGERLEASIADALSRVDALVDELRRIREPVPACA